MAFKDIIDAARSVPGYSGMAIFAGEQPVFTEHLTMEYASRLLSLCRRACEKAGSGNPDACAVAGGFTFYVWGEESFTFILRMSGRYAPKPGLLWAEPDYLDQSSDVLLPARAEVRREAEALLRQYDLLT